MIRTLPPTPALLLPADLSSVAMAYDTAWDIKQHLLFACRADWTIGWEIPQEVESLGAPQRERSATCALLTSTILFLGRVVRSCWKLIKVKASECCGHCHALPVQHVRSHSSPDSSVVLVVLTLAELLVVWEADVSIWIHVSYDQAHCCRE
jgi:hypothetical protein